jgi:hypothetical protein
MVDDDAGGDALMVGEPAEEPGAGGAAPMVDDPVVGAVVLAPGCIADDPDGVAGAPGCIADDPLVVEPDPDAAGRSVDPDGVVGACARAGAAAKAVATRQAAICFFSMFISQRVVFKEILVAQLRSGPTLPWTRSFL